MPWFKVDDNLAFHHKVVAAGNAAMGLWVRAGSFCASQLTDGFVPDHMVAQLGTRRQADKLCSVSLWHRVDGGFIFHQWNDVGRQPTKIDTENAREYERKRKAKRRANEGKDAGQSDVSRRDNSGTPTGTSGGTSSGRSERVPADASRAQASPDPTRPDPSSGHLGQSSHPSNARANTTTTIDDAGLDKIAAATHGDRDHASRVADDILTRSTGTIRDPLSYVLRAIGDDPGRHRSRSGRHPPGPKDPRCPIHPAEYAHNCRSCAADKLQNAGRWASDEPPF